MAGLGMIGGLLGRRASTGLGQAMGMIGGFGLNTLLLKHSPKRRTASRLVGHADFAARGLQPARDDFVPANHTAPFGRTLGGISEQPPESFEPHRAIGEGTRLRLS